MEHASTQSYAIPRFRLRLCNAQLDALLGSQPAPDSIVHARLITPLDSTHQNPDRSSAVLSEPLFSPDHKLILPEGTRLSGAVVSLKKRVCSIAPVSSVSIFRMSIFPPKQRN